MPTPSLVAVVTSVPPLVDGGVVGAVTVAVFLSIFTLYLLSRLHR